MEAVTWAIELGVGVACLVIGAAALRHERLRLVGVLVTVAGVAATGHALVQLLRT